MRLAASQGVVRRNVSQMNASRPTAAVRAAPCSAAARGPLLGAFGGSVAQLAPLRAARPVLSQARASRTQRAAATVVCSAAAAAAPPPSNSGLLDAIPVGGAAKRGTIQTLACQLRLAERAPTQSASGCAEDAADNRRIAPAQLSRALSRRSAPSASTLCAPIRSLLVSPNLLSTVLALCAALQMRIRTAPSTSLTYIPACISEPLSHSGRSHFPSRSSSRAHPPLLLPPTHSHAPLCRRPQTSTPSLIRAPTRPNRTTTQDVHHLSVPAQIRQLPPPGAPLCERRVGCGHHDAVLPCRGANNAIPGYHAAYLYLPHPRSQSPPTTPPTLHSLCNNMVVKVTLSTASHRAARASAHITSTTHTAPTPINHFPIISNHIHSYISPADPRRGEPPCRRRRVRVRGQPPVVS